MKRQMGNRYIDPMQRFFFGYRNILKHIVIKQSSFLLIRLSIPLLKQLLKIDYPYLTGCPANRYFKRFDLNDFGNAR